MIKRETWLEGSASRLTTYLHFLGSGPKGVDDLCFYTYGEFFHVNFSTWPSFLVVCYATLHPALLVGPLVRLSVPYT